ncbi:isopentenyl-diphosphate Delta-isomerase [Nocardioides bigeumensis]|uniref:Isopentenyl-diphosphate Delta-isomerase n=1 Tax=Nocardioides bigeumensis TaxID=433657 RepID=A0ABN2XLW8_9ACTN
MKGAGVELVVLLDEEGRAIGTASKSEVHHHDTPLHLAFSCYVFDDDDRLLVTRRALAKPTWPGVWTNSCCGHPAPGEALADAVRRRVGQELGIAIDDVRVALPGFRYRAVMADGMVENEMCPVAVARCSTPSALDPDPAEVAETCWVAWADFRLTVRTGRRSVSPWCHTQVHELSDDPWQVDATAAGPLPGGLRADPLG